jgi:Lrp/AsnC family transcriptional regulator, leucine-responsive regulatory protein
MVDEFDNLILAALKRNARASNMEIAAEVNLSHSAVSRRIGRLEETQVIKGYTTLIDAAAIGMTVRAFVSVTRESSVAATDLSVALGMIDGVVASYVVTGGQDIFLEVLATDLQAFASLMLTQIQASGGVATTQSIFVMNEGSK